MAVDHNDKLMWELVSNVPYVSKPVAVICIILNFIVPGLGSLVAACSV